jgi:hypothetical protein
VVASPLRVGGPGRRYLRVDPFGFGGGKGTHLSVWLVAQDGMWQPSAEIKLTLVNQADASKSRYKGQPGERTAPHYTQCIC